MIGDEAAVVTLLVQAMGAGVALGLFVLFLSFVQLR